MDRSPQIQDVLALANSLSDVSLEGDPLVDDVWQHPPALKVLDCVLSLNRPYDRFVVPRVAAFHRRHPEVRTTADLLSLIGSYESPFQFSVEELSYRDEGRAETLVGVLRHLREAQQSYGGDSEEERLSSWAEEMEPNDCRRVDVKGFGLAGFQYLRMLFGAETAKPDVHILRFVSEALGREVRDVEALELLERAAQKLEVSLRSADVAIWEQRARGN